MGMGLRALNQVAGLDVLDRLRLRGPAERALHGAARNGFRAAGAAARTFSAASKLGRPARQGKVSSSGQFDLTPTDEQQLLQETVREFALERLRPAALGADNDCAAPSELLEQAAELGLVLLGVPEEVGGVMEERSAVTAVLAAEALAQGDMGLAVAALAPAAVATALGLWGDADQQARYLPPFTGEEPPAAALALLEPQPLFDPFALRTVAQRGTNGDGGYRISGEKALVARAADAELFVVGAMDGGEPGLFIVEPSAGGVETRPEPAMGVRAAGTARVRFDNAPAQRLGDGAAYGEAVQRARLAWCALAIGTGRAVLDYVIPYVNERSAFGEPIAHRQAVAFAVSNIAIELEGVRLATYRAAARADAGKPFARETAVARTLCTSKGMFIGSEGLQLLGGHGYVKEHPVERWYRDLRACGVMEGALAV
jgi:alkylation response protein AidB-like acyl-CoA dehydrogenase